LSIVNYQLSIIKCVVGQSLLLTLHSSLFTFVRGALRTK